MSLRNSLTAFAALLGVGFLISTAAQAQEPPAGGAPGQGRRAGGQGGRRGFQMPAATAFKAVNPTPDQEAKYKTLEEKMRADMMGLRDAAPEERRPKMMEMNKKFTEDVTAILTPEQKPKFEEELKKAQAGMGRPGQGGGGNLMTALDPLNLTADEKTKIEPIVKETQDQLTKLRDDQSVEPAAKREKATKLTDELKSKIKPLLTADQQKQLETVQFLGGAGGGGRRRGGAGAPGAAPGTR